MRLGYVKLCRSIGKRIMRDTRPGLVSVLSILTRELRTKIEKHVDGMSEQDKGRIYQQVVDLLNEGLNTPKYRTADSWVNATNDHAQAQITGQPCVCPKCFRQLPNMWGTT